MALESMRQPRDLEDLAANVIRRGQLYAAEELFAARLEPEQGFEAVGVDEAGLGQVEHEVHHLLLLQALLGGAADGGGRVAGQVAIDADDADAVVFFASDGHDLSSLTC